MSSEEYLDLYLLAQENPQAPYYMVSFDVVNSKSKSNEECSKMLNNIGTIVYYVYNKLLEKEKELNKEILIKDERFFNPWNPPKNEKVLNYNFLDPYVLGDNFCFTVLRDTVTKEEIIDLVNTCKKIIKMDDEFHIADGYYETNEYIEGGTKFFRGYCYGILSNLHKIGIKKKLQRVKKGINKGKII